MDLLLTHGYFLHEDPKELQIMKPYAPLGLLYLSSYLRGAGFDVEIYDSTFGSREELFRMLETETAGDARHLRQPDDARQCAGDSRARLQCGWKVIMGGPEPANYAEQYLAAGAHVVVSGEGELALEAILRAVPLEQIPGLFFRARTAAPSTPAPRDCWPISTRSPGRTANASISTST